MNQGESYQRFRAPQGNGDILCIPDWQSARSLLSANRNILATANLDILGYSLQELSQQARYEMLDASLKYVSNYAESPMRKDVDLPIILSGHQPELFHPGVWLKNFAAARLAQDCGGISINLIIDSDLCRSNTLRIPTGTFSAPEIANVEMDTTSQAIPFEERKIIDSMKWESFGRRCSKELFGFIENPCIKSFWSEIISNIKTDNLGYSIAQARHKQEMKWNIYNLELPQSIICNTPAFHIFCIHILSHAERFRSVYNESLSEYRLAHKLRNSAQPMPDLSKQGDWVETPFWLWSAENPERKALYLSKQKSDYLLSDLSGWQETIRLDNSESALVSLSKFEKQSIKIRTRALTTTLFTRLLLTDLFIHGIGGAKYDQVTDSICSKFFKTTLPKYLTISGTLKLPLNIQESSPSSLRGIRRNIRDLKFHPEKYLANCELSDESSAIFADAQQRKQKWLKTQKNPQNASERHREINLANREMSSILDSLHHDFQQELTTNIKRIRAEKILLSREYSFCLFPQKELSNFLLDL